MTLNLPTVDYKGIHVLGYRGEWDGGGSSFGQEFIPVVTERIGKVGRICEFACGPGFIGFSLLAHTLCDSLCVTDVNEKVLEICKETVRMNDLKDRVSVYHSDVLESIPDKERWDLVVSNPPHHNGSDMDYLGHPDSYDPDWDIHRRFYSRVRDHLNDGGKVLFQENADGSGPSDWREMISAGGLKFVESFKYREGIWRFVKRRAAVVLKKPEWFYSMYYVLSEKS